MRGFYQILALVLCFGLNQITAAAQSNKGMLLAQAALSLTQQKVSYDPSYFVIPYPNGDVPANKGVCTDVVIRAYGVF